MVYLMQQMKREQWLSPEKLEKIQNKRLKTVVLHAYYNTRFYKNLFNECGVTPQDIQTREDLKELKPTKKSDLQENLEDMVAAGYSRENCIVKHTSGSTGTPAVMLYDAYTWDYFVAVSMIEFLETGYQPWEKVAYTKRSSWKSRSLQNLGILRAYHIDSTLPDQEQAALLREINPSLIVSYPTLLYSIAKAASVKGYHIRPKAAIIGGEVLAPHVREYIEDVFKTRVFETYATIEFATIARECFHGNWHINCTQNVVEFDQGKILVTGLINKALPLIRYDIGDIGSPKEGVCPCGRGLPMMQILEGRQGDFVVLPDGREVSPLKFGKTKLVLDSTLAAKRYQIIQEDFDQFVIRVVPTERFTDEIAHKVKAQLVKDLKYPVHVSVECVDKIPLVDDRKLRIIISRVKKR